MSYNPNSSYKLPAEWEWQGFIQLTWPHAETDWKPYLKEITDTFIELTREIAKRQGLLIVTHDVKSTQSEIERRLEGYITKNIVYFQCLTNDTWARDHAAITLYPTHAKSIRRMEARLLDFKFNGWGEKFYWQLDNAINLKLYNENIYDGILENHTDFVLEGGSIESDGEGTIMTTTSCLLAPNRNQPLGKEDIEKRLLNYFNADRVIWIEHGYLAGDDTDGHIDMLVRMAPNNTLLYVGCTDPEDEHYKELLLMKQQLESLRTREGQPYELLELPMPDAIYDDGERLPASYANFVILNNAVIVPTYGQPDKDLAAKMTIFKAFPDREIIGIDATTVIRQHGSLHCLTMQYPGCVTLFKPDSGCLL